MTRLGVLVAAALVVFTSFVSWAGSGLRWLLVLSFRARLCLLAVVCPARLRRALRRDDTRLRARGETALREALGDPEGAFLDWPAAAFADLRRSGELDAVVLFDCRPGEQRFDALVVATGGKTAVELRRRSLDAARIRMLGGRLLEAAYLGFSP